MQVIQDELVMGLIGETLVADSEGGTTARRCLRLRSPQFKRMPRNRGGANRHDDRLRKNCHGEVTRCRILCHWADRSLALIRMLAASVARWHHG